MAKLDVSHLVLKSTQETGRPMRVCACCRSFALDDQPIPHVATCVVPILLRAVAYADALGDFANTRRLLPASPSRADIKELTLDRFSAIEAAHALFVDFRQYRLQTDRFATTERSVHSELTNLQRVVTIADTQTADELDGMRRFWEHWSGIVAADVLPGA